MDNDNIRYNKIYCTGNNWSYLFFWLNSKCSISSYQHIFNFGRNYILAKLEFWLNPLSAELKSHQADLKCVRRVYTSNLPFVCLLMSQNVYSLFGRVYTSDALKGLRPLLSNEPAGRVVY